MTKLAVIHLSDIHIHGESDSCLDRASDLASACFEMAREADACLIALTGDVAYAGKAAQYELAKTRLIEPIRQLMEKETSRPVYVAIVPGNHDCDLIPKDDIRETLIQAVIEDPLKAENESIIEACTKAQENFYNFSNEIASPKPHVYSKIFCQQEFTIGQKTIRVSSLNAAWMSVIKEEQGKLIYPIKKFETPLAKHSCIHLALIHHPFNWQTQESYQHLRKRLRLSCTAILSGHEHTGNAGKIEDQLTGNSIFLEAAALQPHESTSEAGFSAYLFDLVEKKVVSQSFELTHTNVRAINSVTYSWNDEAFIHGALDITDGFSNTLNDPGGNFTHSAKDKLTLEDIFVWPDVKDWENEDINKQKGRSSQQLLTKIKSGEDTLIYGSDKSGKTTLLFWYFKELIAQGYAPVYLSLSDTSISNWKDAQKKVTQAIEAQYKNPNAVAILPKEKKILLLDDMDRIKSGLRTLHNILEYSERNYYATCMTGGGLALR